MKVFISIQKAGILGSDVSTMSNAYCLTTLLIERTPSVHIGSLVEQLVLSFRMGLDTTSSLSM